MILSAHTSLNLHAALIIPAFNDADGVARLLRAVPPSLFQVVVVADSGSSDDTREAARRSGALVVVQRSHGYGASCLAAVHALPPEIDTIVFMDAGCAEDASDAHKLLLQLGHNHMDLVIGYPLATGPDAASMLNPVERFALHLIRLLWGQRFQGLGTFRAVRRQVLTELGVTDQYAGWPLEMQIKALLKGYRIAEIPVSRCGHQKPASDGATGTRRLGDYWRTARILFRLRRQFGAAVPAPGAATAASASAKMKESSDPGLD